MGELSQSEARMRKYIVVGVLGIVALVLFAFLHRHSTLPDPDAFYHAKMALLLREGVSPHTFPWLPFTTLAERFADQQLLYHLVLVPFVSFVDPLVGVTFASVIFATLAFVSFYFFFRTIAPRFAFFGVLSFFTSSTFLSRILFGKAQPLAFILLAFFCIALFRKKIFLTFVIAFLLVWAHGSWPVALFIAAVFFLFRERRVALSAIVGFLAGLIVHPAFPNTLTFFWDQTVRIAGLGLAPYFVGQEWHAPSFADLATGAPLHVFFTVLLFPFFFLALERRHLTVQSFTLFLVAGVLAFFTLRSHRYLEFAVPFVTAAFLSFIPPRATWRIADCIPSPLTRRVATLVFVLALPLIVIQSIRRTDTIFREGYSLDYLARSAKTLTALVPRNDTVVLSNWSVFPQLFFHTEATRFLMGLDPRFLYFRDPKRFAAWEELWRHDGRQPSRVLRETIRAPYLLVLQRDTPLLERARGDAGFAPLYEDDEVVLFSAL